MKKNVLAMCMLLSGLMVTSALAAEEKPAATAPQERAQYGIAGSKTNVSQRQIDIVTKRQEARKRRDEMLKKRKATILKARQEEPRENR